MTRPRRPKLVVAGLLALSLVPIVAGGFRLSEIAVGVETPENARFFGFGLAIFGHIIGATVYSIAGAFQFLPSLRRRPWHRRAGRVLAPAGVIAAATGVWMAVSPELPDTNSLALVVMRVVFGVGMIAAITLGVVAAVRRRFAHHRAWMIRGYALGIAAGTQVFTHLPLQFIEGPPDATQVAIAMGAGWVINLAVAEVAIRRGQRPRRTAVAPDRRRRADAAFL